MSSFSTWLRSVGAILLGFIAVIVITIPVDILCHRLGIFPPEGQPLTTFAAFIATFYRTLFGVFGCYITARFAPNRPMGHALLGGAIGTAIAIAGTIYTWNLGPAYGPHWYSVALVLTSMPAAWLVGWLRVSQLRGVPPSA